MNGKKLGRPCFLLTVLLALTAVPVLGQDSLNTAAIDAAVQAEMERQQIVGAAVGVIRNGEIAYLQAYGFADRESNRKVTTDTVFNWASNSKPLIAVRVMQLVHDGKLDLDKPVGDYIRDLGSDLKKVTCREILCHQSGIPHYRNGRIVPSPALAGDLMKQLDPRIAVRRFEQSPLIFEPGERTDYSSYAYVLLSAVVEAAGNEPVMEQLKKNIVDPIGLGSFQLDLPVKNQPYWTSGYRKRGGNVVKINDYAHFWKHGAGGYKTNIKDFARWAVALMNRELIDEKTTRQMWTRQALKSGKASSYGLGVLVGGEGRDLKISHGGSQDETKTRLVIYPSQRHGVVVMCNSNHADPGKISTAVYRAINNGK